VSPDGRQRWARKLFEASGVRRALDDLSAISSNVSATSISIIDPGICTAFGSRLSASSSGHRHGYFATFPVFPERILRPQNSVDCMVGCGTP